MTAKYFEGQQKRITYNGWANRSTWLAVLWLPNQVPTYDDLLRIARSSKLDWQKEKELKDYLFDLLLGEDSPLEQVFPTRKPTAYEHLASGLISDLVGQELREIDYQAIIESVEECDKDGTELTEVMNYA